MTPTLTTTILTPTGPAVPPATSPSSWELAKVAIERAIATDSKTVLVLAFTAPAGDPLGWLAHHQAVPSMYWRGRDGWEYAGIGAAHVIAKSGTDAMRECADEAAQFVRERVIHESSPQARKPRFFGGFAFDPLNADRGIWREGGFGDAVLVLPEAVYARRDAQSYVFFSFEVTPRSAPESLVERLALLNQHYWSGFDAPPPSLDTSFDFAGTTDHNDHARWVKHSTDILRRIESGALHKVVLALRQTAHANDRRDIPRNPWPVVAALRDFDSACDQFGFQFSDRHAFLGASPERLFRLSGRRLESEAIAGTIPRGADDAEDRVLGERLLASAKDQLEHRYVVDAIRNGLMSLADGRKPMESQLDLVRLRTLQHLRSTMEVDLHETVTIGGILNILHPTPATAGVPRDQALDTIRRHEADSRGWYGGPVGWIGADAAEFVVGIRSALVSVDTAWLYGGAGLVSGSIPENEWREIQDKLQAFRSAVSSPRRTP